MRWSKTNKYRQGSEEVIAEVGGVACPVQMLKEYLHLGNTGWMSTRDWICFYFYWPYCGQDFFSVFTSQTFSLVCEGATSTSNLIFVYIVFVSLLTSVVCGYFFSCLQIQVCFWTVGRGLRVGRKLNLTLLNTPLHDIVVRTVKDWGMTVSKGMVITRSVMTNLSICYRCCHKHENGPVWTFRQISEL